jgi:CBS domain-containing protein
VGTAEIMTPRTDLVAVDVEADLSTVLQTIQDVGHSRMPVYEENVDTIVGLIYAKDLLGEIGKNPEQFHVRERMREVYFVPETKPLRALLHEFQDQKLHIAVVLDEFGGTAGIVTLEDILEELVGPIADEYEETPAESVKRLDENTIEVDARTYVDDLNDEYALDLPEDEDYDTVGGFVSRGWVHSEIRRAFRLCEFEVHHRWPSARVRRSGSESGRALAMLTKDQAICLRVRLLRNLPGGDPFAAAGRSGDCQRSKRPKSASRPHQVLSFAPSFSARTRIMAARSSSSSRSGGNCDAIFLPCTAACSRRNCWTR